MRFPHTPNVTLQVVIRVQYCALVPSFCSPEPLILHMPHMRHYCADVSAVFPIAGLVLDGAGWSSDTNSLEFSRQHRTALPTCLLRWSLWKETVQQDSTTEGQSERCGVRVPMYLNHNRTEFIVAVQLPAPESVPALAWRERGVALLAWTLSL